MSNAGAIRAGRAFVEIFADDSKAVRALKSLQKRMETVGESMVNIGKKTLAVGATITGGIATAALAFAKMGDTVGKASQRTGMSAEAMSQLGYAASQSGASLEEVEAGVRKMQNALADAAAGSDTAKAALAKLGVTAKELAGMSPDQQFVKLADGIAAIQDPAQRTAAAMDVFGKGGAALLPLMSEGAKGVQQLMKRADELGLTIRGIDATRATALGDALDDLKGVGMNTLFRAGSAVAYMLTQLTEIATKHVVALNQWITRNEHLVVTALKIGAAVTAAGAALIVGGVAMKGIALATGVASKAWVLFGGAMKLAGVTLMALASPIGIITAAVVGLGGYLLYTSGNGAKALGWLGEKFQQLRGVATDAIGGIGDAIAAGDMRLAAEVLWAGLKLAWEVGTQEIKQKWNSVTTSMVIAVEEAWAGVQIAWDIGATFVSQTWTKMIGGMTKALAVGTASWQTMIEKSAGWIADRLLEVQGFLDPNFDVDYAKSARAKMTTQNVGNIKRETDNKLAGIDADTEATLQKKREAHAKKLAEIAERSAALVDAHRQGATEKAEQLRQQLADAVAAFNEVRGRAADARAGDGADAPEGSFSRDPQSLREGVEAAVGSTRGTFSAANLGQLFGSDNVQSRIASAAEETARQAKRIERAIIRHGQPKFT